MSPRAAWRLEQLGFDPVYDYVAGKVDWMAAGLSTVRAREDTDRVIAAADTNPRTCAPDTPITAIDAVGEIVVVVNEHNIVLGRIDNTATTVEINAIAADIMV